jgi:cysteine desulfurase
MEKINENRVYLDNAATTIVRQEVLDEMIPVFRENFGNASSIYREGQRAKATLEYARVRVAKVLNADPSEIYFTSCGSESDNWAIKGAAYRHKNKGMHIITSAIEHHAVLHTCAFLEKQGYSITYLPVDEYGLVTAEQVASAIRPDTILVSIMMANNEIGTIEPIADIAAVCKERKVLFHTDAVQAAGAIRLDVKDLGIDLLSLSGHKLYGPKGVGVLYIRKGVAISNFMDGGAQERGRRAGTENLAGIVGFAKALELSTDELDEHVEKTKSIRDKLIKEVLEKIPHTRLNGHPDLRLAGNANFSFEFIEGESLLLLLDHMGFACSSGSACTSGSLDPSHVLLAIGLPHEIAHGSLRVSIGKYNTEEEVLTIVPALEMIVSRLREMSPLYDDYVKGKATAFTVCDRCSK